ncbi:MAG: hypothetical protein ACE5RH_02685 [Nitrosarchaeum sp.]
MKKWIPVFLIIMLCSCAMLGLQQDPGMKGLLYAKSEIASLAEQYEVSYQNASLIAQLNWKDRIDPLFLQANDILQEWEYYLNLGKDTTSIKDKYITIRNVILKSLVEIEKG